MRDRILGALCALSLLVGCGSAPPKKPVSAASGNEPASASSSSVSGEKPAESPAPCTAPGDPYPRRKDASGYPETGPWKQRAGFLWVTTGSEGSKCSDSQFSSRQSTAAIEGMASHVKVVRELGRLEQRGTDAGLKAGLKKLGLELVVLRAAPPDPGDYNVFVEEADYTEEGVDGGPGLSVMTAYHVRILEPAERRTFESKKVAVKTKPDGTMSDQDAQKAAKSVLDARREILREMLGFLAEKLPKSKKGK
jgi:hypothetical protein